MSSNKKVLYISYDGMTDPLGQSQVIPYLEQLTKQGYRFTILSVEKKKRLQKSGNEVGRLLAGMGIEWKTLTITTKPPILSKIYDQWKLNSTSARLQREQKFDLIHCRSYVAAAAGLKLFRHSGVPFLFDMRGFWVDERVDSGHWNIRNPIYHFLYKLYKKKEKQYFKNAAHIVSLTQKGKEELTATYDVPAEKISVIPCCVDLGHFDYDKIDNGQKQQLKKKLGLSENDKVLCYLGSLGGWYMTDEMMDFFAVMKKKIHQAKFLFITHDNRQQIIKKAILKGINEADILVQPATRNEVPLYLSVSDWSIFFIKDVYSKKASSPTKQGEIMAMGIPIVCNDIGDTGKIIKESGTGIVIGYFDKEEYNRVTNCMEGLLSLNKEELRRSAFNYYDLQQGAIIYYSIYQQIVSR
jgi:glycosyltransferase involved in cell wall biosynthesis